MVSNYSHPLCQINDDNAPCGYASACLVDCRGVRYLLTVSHAAGNNGRWALEIGYDEAVGKTRLQPLGGWTFIASAKLKASGAFTKPRAIDFALCRLPSGVVSYKQEITPLGKVISEEPLRAFDISDIVAPDQGESYSIYGLVEPNLYAGNLTRTRTGATNMKYTGTADGLHRFQTPVPYRSYKEFQGCSGGPIMDSKGRLAGLVVEGDKHKTAIMGLDIRPIVAVIDIQDQL